MMNNEPSMLMGRLILPVVSNLGFLNRLQQEIIVDWSSVPPHSLYFRWPPPDMLHSCLLEVVVRKNTQI
jgi:hypothetical protein